MCLWTVGPGWSTAANYSCGNVKLISTILNKGGPLRLSVVNCCCLKAIWLIKRIALQSGYHLAIRY